MGRKQTFKCHDVPFDVFVPYETRMNDTLVIKNILGNLTLKVKFRKQMSNTDRVNLSIERAVQHANALAHEYVTLEHLLYAIMEENDVSDMLTKMKVDVAFWHKN